MGRIGTRTSANAPGNHFADKVNELGYDLSADRVYLQDGESPTTGDWRVQMQNSKGGVIILSPRYPAGRTMAQLASGSALSSADAAYYTAIADQCISLKGAVGVIVCPFHEPEDDVESGKFTAADYRTVMGRLHKLFRDKGLRVGQILMQYTLETASGRSITDFFVSSSQIVFWDHYNKGNAGDAPRPPYRDTDPRSTHTKFVAGLDRIRSFCNSVSVPWGIAEFGVARREVDTTGAERSAELQACADEDVFHGGEFVCYWEADYPAPDANRADYAIADEPASLQAFVQATDGLTPIPEPDPCEALEAQLADVQAQLAIVQLQLGAAETDLNNTEAELTQVTGALVTASNKLSRIEAVAKSVKRPSAAMKQIIAICDE